MLSSHIIATVNQQVLRFLTKFSDKEFYERQIARKIGIAYGSANHALNELHSTSAIKRRREGKMYFYSADISNAATIKFKKLINITLIEPLIERLKDISSRIILYGSCAQGTDASRSDVDLFIVSEDREQIVEAIANFSFPQGFEDIHIQPIIKSPAELLEAGESEQVFLEEVERGTVLWERAANEPGV